MKLLIRNFNSSNLFVLFFFLFFSFFFFFENAATVFFGAVRNKLQTKKYLLELIKRRSKVYEKNMSCGHALNLNYKKLFPKTINQWEFHYDMFAKLPRILLLVTFCTAQTYKIILTWSCQKLPCQLNSRAVFRQRIMPLMIWGPKLGLSKKKN